MIEIIDTIDSTNAELARRWHAGTATSGDALRAHHQTAGRGRNGRSFEAEAGEALLISVLFELPTHTSKHIGWLTLATAMAMRVAINEHAPIDTSALDQSNDVSIKWPNDLHIDGKKLGGVLGELVDADPCIVVLGCGINTDTTSPFPGATSLKLAGRACNEETIKAIAETFVTELIRRVLDIANNDTAQVRAEAQDAISTIGQPIEAQLADATTVRATAVGIDDSGALLLDNGTALTQADITHLYPSEGIS